MLIPLSNSAWSLNLQTIAFSVSAKLSTGNQNRLTCHFYILWYLFIHAVQSSLAQCPSPAHSPLSDTKFWRWFWQRAFMLLWGWRNAMMKHLTGPDSDDDAPRILFWWAICDAFVCLFTFLVWLSKIWESCKQWLDFKTNVIYRHWCKWMLKEMGTLSSSDKHNSY